MYPEEHLGIVALRSESAYSPESVRALQMKECPCQGIFTTARRACVPQEDILQVYVTLARICMS